MKTLEFEGHSSKMKGDALWLSSEDILGKGDVNVQIAKCNFQQDAVFDGGRKEDCYTLAFTKATKELVLNATNRKTLVKHFGVNVKDWKEKWITLYVDQNVQMKGQTVNGIRIRQTLPPTPKARPKADAPPDEQPPEPAAEPRSDHSPLSYEGLFESIQQCSTMSEVEMVESRFRAAELEPEQLKEIGDMIESARATYRHGDA
jgi:hypothetical protein